ncbi:hypothetical protein B0H16DRAFT_1693900 [Mycena metata]|uniref:DUF5648 domain-containing protein n=1 Tax=Mycena metata TaxID=1033252 RepID=A0AAD7IFG1_9AGAR|nr:hypothetical protein B0H16DRAFT_1693900 [Mycena metata]
MTTVFHYKLLLPAGENPVTLSHSAHQDVMTLSISLFVLVSLVPFTDNFYSTDPGQITAVVGSQGAAFVGTAARVFTSQELSTVPFFHLFDGTINDSFYTTSTFERDLALANGYVVGGPDTFIYPTQICGSIPFFRLYDSALTEHFYTTNAAVQASMLASGGWADEGVAGYVLDANVCA